MDAHRLRGCTTTVTHVAPVGHPGIWKLVPFWAYFSWMPATHADDEQKETEKMIIK